MRLRNDEKKNERGLYRNHGRLQFELQLLPLRQGEFIIVPFDKQTPRIHEHGTL